MSFTDKMRFLFVLFLNSLIAYCSCSNTKVYSNMDSTCLCNDLVQNCACTLAWNNILVTYQNVDDVKMCKTHYCVQSGDTVNCAGRVFENLGGTRTFNPLTPNVKMKGFPLKDSVKEYHRGFRGFNLKTKYFEYGVHNTFTDIDRIECDNDYGTCIHFRAKNSNKICFGLGSQYTLHEEISSFFLGVFIQFSLTLPFTLFLHSFLRNRANALYLSTLFIVTPLSLVASMMIINFSTTFIIKVYVYLLGCCFGILLADVITKSLTNLWYYLVPKNSALEVLTEEQSKDLVTGSDSESECDSIDESIEIELKEEKR